MLHITVNGHPMAYIEIGSGRPLVAIHGSLGDFRSWAPVMGPLSRHHRLIVPSLRRFFPEIWDGKGGGYTIPQHVADVIAFIEALDCGPVDLMGHSRGDHIVFRVAHTRPDLVAKLILAEPGGELDGTLMASAGAPSTARTESIALAAERIAAGDIDGGLQVFVDRIGGPGTWARRPAASKQMRRDNAGTLIGQINEQRAPFSKAEAEAVRAETLLIGGALTKGLLREVLDALTTAIPGARAENIPDAGHSMFEQAPQRFSEIVLEFLATGR